MSALPGVPEDVARRHVEAWAGALGGGREPLVVLDEPVESLPVERLRAAAEAGRPVVVAVRDVERSAAEALAERIGAQVAGVQLLVHGSLIAGPGQVPAEAPASVTDGAGADRACRVLLTANVGEDELSRAASAQLMFALESVHGAQLLRLEAAYWSLRRANARLTRENLGRHDAAAASIVGRLSTELKTVKHQLEIEIEVARRNDEYFQAARAKLNEPHHRAAERLFGLLRVVPGGQALSRKALSRGR